MLDVEDQAEPLPGKMSKPSQRITGKRARYGGRDRRHPLRVTVTPDEKVEIQTRAKTAGLSVASYLRAVALGRQVQSVLDLRAVNDLVKVAGDQGRLGNLLKLWLVDQPGRGAPEIEVCRVLNRISDVQGALAALVSRV